MSVNFDLIKSLRESSGVSITECKKALEEANGDLNLAIEVLRKNGILKASTKTGREVKDGCIGSYVHQTGRIASLVELNCETDFVARTDEFKDLAHTLAVQVSGMNPLYISIEDIPDDVIKKESKIIIDSSDIKSKPKAVIDNILKGKLEKFYEQVCLLEQPFYKDPKVKVKDLVNGTIAKIGENIKVSKIVRLEIGN